MTDNNIKFVVVGRPSDQTILGAEAPYAIKTTIKQEVLIQIPQGYTLNLLYLLFWYSILTMRKN